jgi:hypothetical protein
MGKQETQSAGSGWVMSALDSMVYIGLGSSLVEVGWATKVVGVAGLAGKYWIV